MWEDCDYKAFALFPYSSAKDGFLNLIQGDVLQITKQTNDWVYGKCLSTSCVGICPKSYIGNFDTEFDRIMRIIEPEVRFLIEEIFRNVLIPAKEDDETTYKVIDLVQQIESYFPWKKDEEINIQQLIKSIDELRLLLHHPNQMRANNGTIMRTHDIELNYFLKAAQAKAVYPTTINLDFKIETTSQTLQKSYAVRCFLYNFQSQQPVTHPKTTIINNDHLSFNYITPDIDPKYFEINDKTKASDLAFITMITDYDDKSMQCLDYLAVSAEFLSTKERTINLGHDQSFSLTFYKPKEGLFSNCYDKILNSNINALLPATEIPGMRVTFRGTETQQRATSNNVQQEEKEKFNEQNTFLNIKYPNNASTNFNVNSLTIQIVFLHHKSKMKDTRIICRIIDLDSPENYLPAFLGTQDPTQYATALQRGTLDMHFEEVCEITLDKNVIKNPNSTFIVFFVERRKSHEYVYISSYAYIPLTNSNTNAFYEFSDSRNIRKLKVMKPPKPTDFNSISQAIKDKGREECFKEPGDPGYIEILTTLVSPIYSSDPKINNLMNCTADQEANFADLHINIPTIFYAWGYRILLKLAQLISVNNPATYDTAINVFLNILQDLTQNANRDSYYLHVLDEFKMYAFNGDYPELAQLGSELIKYAAQAFEGGKLDTKLLKGLAHLLSISVDSMNYAKRANISVNENEFNQAFKQVFIATSDKIASKSTVQTIRVFLINAFPPILQLMSYSLSQKEIIDLTIKLIKDSAELQDDSQQQTGKVTQSTFIRLTSQLCKAEIFTNPEIRKALFPVLIEELSQKGIEYEMTINMLFAMKGTSPSFADELLNIVTFIPTFIKDVDPATPNDIQMRNFAILFIYYASSSVLAELVKKGQDNFKFFHKIVNLLINAVDTVENSIVFSLVPAFVKVFLLSQTKEFQDFTKNVIDLIDMISSFYSHFLSRLEKFSTLDRSIYSIYYSMDLAPISRLLPPLIASVPQNYHFDQAIFIPLFHMYISTQEENIRESVKKALGSIFTAEGKKFSVIEKPVVHALIAIMKVQGLSEIPSIFTILEEIDPSSKESIQQVTELAKNIANLESFPPNAQFEDEYTEGILSVLDRCRRTEDYSIFPHFCLLLYDLHISLNSYVEAAETLIECISVLEKYWKSNDRMSADSIFPDQTQKNRIIAMLKKAYELFMQAQFFERAVVVADKLREIAENSIPDYEELANIIDLQARAWTEIVSTERTVLNRFYGVKFFGTGFNEYHRDRVFVYRRGGYFDNGQMLNYIRQKFPNAEVSPRLPGDDDKDKDYIYVFNVKPNSDDYYCPEEAPAETMVRTVCNKQEFFSEVPVRVRIEGKKYNEIAEYHRHITTYKIAQPLQGITRRSLVIHTEGPRIMTPVECAVVDTNAKSLELLQKASSYWRCLIYNVNYDKTAVSAFSMLINGIVNAAVNGGTKLFQELFLEGELSLLPDNKKWAPKLVDAFVTQLKVVNFAISVHNQVVDDAFRPLHNQICEQFVEMQKTMEPHTGKIDFTDNKTGIGEIPVF